MKINKCSAKSHHVCAFKGRCGHIQFLLKWWVFLIRI